MMNYLLFGFPLNENEELRKNLISLYEQKPNYDLVSKYIHEDPKEYEAFFGVILEKWGTRNSNIDVRKDTQRYLERKIIQDIKDNLKLDLSLNKFRILGFSKPE